MAKTNTNAYKPTGYRFESVKFTSADTTTTKTVGAASANDSAIKGLIITSDDTSACNLKLILHDGSTEFVIDTKNVPIASGTNGTVVPVDGLSGAYLPLDGAAKKFLPMEAGWTLKAALVATMTAAKTLTVTAVFEDY